MENGSVYRIEEESEGLDDVNRAVRTVFSQGSLDRERNFVIPRSISEQVRRFVVIILLSNPNFLQKRPSALIR